MNRMGGTVKGPLKMFGGSTSPSGVLVVALLILGCTMSTARLLNGDMTPKTERSLKGFDLVGLYQDCPQGKQALNTIETMTNDVDWWKDNWGRIDGNFPRRGTDECWANRDDECALPDVDHVVCLPGSKRGSTANKGWALDPKGQSCQPGVHCLYACEPGYYWTMFNQSETSNFDSVMGPQRGHCDGTWDYGTSTHGVYCKEDGTLDLPADRPLCQLGETYVYAENHLDTHVYLCQTVFPGHEIFLIPTLVKPGESVMLTTQPKDYWSGPTYEKPTHGDFYVSFAGADIMEACTWDEISPSGASMLPFEIGSGVEDDGIVYSTHYFYQQPNSEVPASKVGYNLDLECESSEPGVCGPVFRNADVVKVDTLRRPQDGTTKVKFVFKPPEGDVKFPGMYHEPNINFLDPNKIPESSGRGQGTAFIPAPSDDVTTTNPGSVTESSNDDQAYNAPQTLTIPFPTAANEQNLTTVLSIDDIDPTAQTQEQEQFIPQDQEQPQAMEQKQTDSGSTEANAAADQTFSDPQAIALPVSADASQETTVALVSEVDPAAQGQALEQEQPQAQEQQQPQALEQEQFQTPEQEQSGSESSIEDNSDVDQAFNNPQTVTLPFTTDVGQENLDTASLISQVDPAAQEQAEAQQQEQHETLEQDQSQAQEQAQAVPQEQEQAQSQEQVQEQGQPQAQEQEQGQPQAQEQEQAQPQAQEQEQAQPQEQEQLQAQEQAQAQAQIQEQEQPQAPEQVQERDQPQAQEQLQEQEQAQPQGQDQPQVQEQLQEQEQAQPQGQDQPQAQEQLQEQEQAQPQGQEQPQAQVPEQTIEQDQAEGQEQEQAEGEPLPLAATPPIPSNTGEQNQTQAQLDTVTIPFPANATEQNQTVVSLLTDVDPKAQVQGQAQPQAQLLQESTESGQQQQDVPP